MTDCLVTWQPVTTKKELTTRLQAFHCTEPWPTTPGGRRLPQHRRLWEWEAQRHIRNLGQLLRPGDRVLVGVDTSMNPPVDAAVLHLRFAVRERKLLAKLEAGAVATTHRSPGPPFLGDEIMAAALSEACTALRTNNCTTGLLAGHIHVKNNASMRMAARNGWEPISDPNPEGYVRWTRRLP
jgi:hypothetical protein